MNIKVPQCGTSDERNIEYDNKYTREKFYKEIVKNENPVIFDVGAHKGESVIFFKSIFETSKIYSFEPSKINFIDLVSVSKKYDSIAYNLAISDKSGVSDFYTQEITHLGGLLPINKKSKDSLGYAANASNSKAQVECVTLDDFCIKNNISNIDILKIDVQGFETNVLKGADEALKFVNVVQIEIILFDFYENTKDNWIDVNLILSEQGFKLWDISKISKNPKNFRTDWVEAVYVRL